MYKRNAEAMLKIYLKKVLKHLKMLFYIVKTRLSLLEIGMDVLIILLLQTIDLTLMEQIEYRNFKM